jgi:DNA mismatch endonuclease, patch repair protein
MVDVVSPKTRSQMMSSIRGKNTKPEMVIRKALHQRGFRYRLHVASLPGKPDLVFPKYKAVIQINGCFWHGHNCKLFKWPSTRPEFWKNKITSNLERDTKNIIEIEKQGWRVLTIWECAVKGRDRKPFKNLIEQISSWITVSEISEEVSGVSSSLQD